VNIARANVIEIDAVPTGWKLENYPGQGIALWNTPASECSGHLSLPANATTDDNTRLWATISAAIIAQHQVFVRYDNVSCTIASFGMYGT
jgi:hypothetical protein